MCENGMMPSLEINRWVSIDIRKILVKGIMLIDRSCINLGLILSICKLVFALFNIKIRKKNIGRETDLTFSSQNLYSVASFPYKVLYKQKISS